MKKILLTLAALLTVATAMASHYVIFNPSETQPLNENTLKKDGVEVYLYGNEAGATGESYFFSSYMYITYTSTYFNDYGARLMSVEFVGAPYLMIFEYYYAYHQQRGHTAIEGNSAIWQDGYYDQDGAFHPYAEEDYKNGIVEADPHYSDGRFSNGVVFLKFASPAWRVDINEIRIKVYDPTEVPPVEPTEKTGAPTFNGYTEDGLYAYFVEINETEPSTIYYRVIYPDGTVSDWAEYEETLSFTDEGSYRVEAYAVADGKLPSEVIAYEFTLDKPSGVSEITDGKQVAGVRYFNMAGQEMQQANGLTIMITTYTDGTTSAMKVIK